MTIAITLGYGPARILEPSLRAFYATKNPGHPLRHFWIDAQYPVDKEKNRRACRDLCAELGIEVLDPGRNLGLHGNFNWAMEQIAPAGDEIVIAFDGDSMPVSPGWDVALVRAIQGSGGRVVWSSLMNPRSRADLEARGYDRFTVDGYIEAWATRHSVTNSICAWRCGWLKEIGGLQEPLLWYGHLESAMWNHVLRTGKKWAFLPQWTETDELRDLHDRAYVVWKWRFSHERKTDLDFETWYLSEWSRDLDNAPDRIP